MKESDFTGQLLGWYAVHARKLPWRSFITNIFVDPYKVWVSEIMLQQTRVDTVIPYFARWMQHFPTLASLSAASQQEVLKVWEGLGYYSRARNLHASAQIVMRDFNGELPQEVLGLRLLPGIGEYTASAIASFAFGKDEYVLDGNVRRVLARVFDVDMPLGSKEAEVTFHSLAKENLPSGRAGDYNQSLMDLGAVICLPNAPRCASCPLKACCRSQLLGIQESRPVRKEKTKIPHYTVTAAVIRRDSKVLIACRKPEKLLGGLWEFPGGKIQDGEDLSSCLKREICEELAATVSVGKSLGTYRHAFTHFRITLHAFECSLATEDEPENLEHSALAWVHPEQLINYPMGKVDRQISNHLMKVD